MLNNSTSKVLAALALTGLAIFAPNPSNVLDSRMLAAEGEEPATKRALQETYPPKGTGIQCPAGKQEYKIDWKDVEITKGALKQTIKFPNDVAVDLAVTTTGEAKVNNFEKQGDYLWLSSAAVPTEKDVIDPAGGSDPEFPENFVTLEFTFPEELDGLYISSSDIDSVHGESEVVRIRMFDAAGNDVSGTFAPTGDVVVKDNFAYQPKPGINKAAPGLDASLYGKANGKVKSIKLDASVLVYNTDKGEIGNYQTKWLYPSAGFGYCGEPEDGGVNGDPLIMGLSGQLFKFDGRNGAWYSAVSTPSFQWNLKVQEYEKCPAQSNSFVSGAGFTFFDEAGKTSKRIEVNVANPYNIDVGCGDKDMDHCLGAGSLEIVIDGVKHTVGGDYKTEDGTARVLAFNTFFQCSRKWYDFDVRPSLSKDAISLRSGRSLKTSEPSIFDVISGLKETMIDEKECEKWIHERKAHSDLFQQPGHYTTVIIKTPEVTLHLEYKQENERCEAHSIDVWISSVSDSLMAEDWEGVIGETKDVNYVSTGKQVMKDRFTTLKYDSDESYEVNSPFSTSCKGCHQKK